MKPWKNRPKWAKPLTAAEWKHVNETTNRGTKLEVECNIAEHERVRAFNPPIDPCWECLGIGRKLGLIQPQKTEEANTCQSQPTT